jgi:hypothetical protein
MTNPVLAVASVILWLALGVSVLRYSRNPEKVRRTVERRAKLYSGANLFRDQTKQVVFEVWLSRALAVVLFGSAVVMAVVLLARW